MDDRLELLIMSYGLDGLCDLFDIELTTVVKVLVAEGYVTEEDLYELFEEYTEE